MTCGNCRGEMPEGAKYCTVCGSIMPDWKEASEIPSGPLAGTPQINVPRHESGPEAAPARREGSFKPRVYVDTFVPPAQAEASFRRIEPGESSVQSSASSQLYQGQRTYGLPVSGNETAPPQTPATNPVNESSFGQGHMTEAGSGMETGMTAGKFFIMELLAMIPLVGLVVMCVWAFGRGVNDNRAALAQAKLITMLMMTFIMCTAFVVLLILASNNMITLKWITFG